MIRRLLLAGLAVTVTAYGSQTVPGALAAPTEPIVTTTTGPPETIEGFECPITIPEARGFEAPDPYPATYPHDGDGMVWYGSEDLWTALPLDGDYRPRKSVWWSAHYAGAQRPQIEVTWTRLDLAATPPPHAHDAQTTGGYTGAEGWFMIAGFDPHDDDGHLTAGCWRVEATYEGATLSYVYEAP